jgi:stage V sporulation protein AE
MEKRKIIVVTDGDRVARRTVERASKNIGARCISASAGNPTTRSGVEIVELVKEAPHDPVVVMLDDRGCAGEGSGEKVLRHLTENPEIEILGAVAVAANSPCCEGIKVDCSFTREGNLVHGPVDKNGYQEARYHEFLEGDTVEVINELDIPIVIGLGDPGKMDGADDFRKGAPITTMALREILNRSGF